MRILSRLGCSSSPDIHDRFVTQHAMANRQTVIWDQLSSTCFTICSVDNFDMLQSYSAVFCGDQQRSYHGKTLQLVQPHVSSLETSATELTCMTVTDNSEVPDDDQPFLTQSSSNRKQFSNNDGSTHQIYHLLSLETMGPSIRELWMLET